MTSIDHKIYIFSMGGACSRKRGQLEDEDNLYGGVPRRYSKSGSSKWLATSFSRPAIDIQLGTGECPSLMDLCIHKICEVLSFQDSTSVMIVYNSDDAHCSFFLAGH